MADFGLSCHVDTFEKDIVSTLRDTFPKEVITEIFRHEGDFGAREIEEYGTRANALVLTCNGGESHRRGGTIEAELLYDLFILVKGTVPTTRTRGMRLIFEQVLKLLHSSEPWSVSDETWGRPDNVKHKNMYGPRTDDFGLALWVVRWEQKLHIPQLEDASTLDDFARLYAEYVRPGEPDPPVQPFPSDQIELPIE